MMILCLLFFSAFSIRQPYQPKEEELDYESLAHRESDAVADQEKIKSEFLEKVQKLQKIINHREFRKDVRLFIDEYFAKVGLTPNLIKKSSKIPSLQNEFNKVEAQLKRTRNILKEAQSGGKPKFGKALKHKKFGKKGK